MELICKIISPNKRITKYFGSILLVGAFSIMAGADNSVGGPDAPPGIIIQPGIYHFRGMDTSESCDYKVEIPEAGHSLFMTPVTNQRTAYYCKDTSVWAFHWVLNKQSQWELSIPNYGWSIIQISPTEMQSVAKDNPTIFEGLIERVGNKSVKALHFVDSSRFGWVFNNIDSVYCTVEGENGSSEKMACVYIDATYLSNHHICDNLKKSLTEKVKNQCLSEGNLNCHQVKASGFHAVVGSVTSGDYKFTGCIGEVRFEGQ